MSCATGKERCFTKFPNKYRLRPKKVSPVMDSQLGHAKAKGREFYPVCGVRAIFQDFRMSHKQEGCAHYAAEIFNGFKCRLKISCFRSSSAALSRGLAPPVSQGAIIPEVGYCARRDVRVFRFDQPRQIVSRSEFDHRIDAEFRQRIHARVPPDGGGHLAR